MKRSLILLFALLYICFSPAYPSPRGRTSSSSAERKTVHVKSYTRKDGTFVPAHDRRAARSSGSSRSRASLRTPKTHAKRSAAARRAFMQSNPCPSTGRSSGACRGYVVDHIKPLACGGRDDPTNMQWQTKEASKEKDKWERKGCR